MSLDKLQTKKEILAFLGEHPGWVLQYCYGVRGNNWWWVREAPTSSVTIACHGTAARCAAKTMVLSADSNSNAATYTSPASK